MSSHAAVAQKQRIRSQADLPATRFQLRGPPSQAFLDPVFVSETLPQLRAEAERLRADYDVQDQALAQELRAGLVTIAVLQGRSAEARSLIVESRAATAKPQLKAIGMLTLDAASTIIDGAAEGRCARGAEQITRMLSAADAQVIRDEALQRRASLEVVSAAFVAGVAKAEIDPGAASDGGRIGLLDGLKLANWRAFVEVLAPCRAPLSAAIQGWAVEPAHRAINIWTAREPSSHAFAAATPVVVAVWDSGVDRNLFPGQLAVDPSDRPDGRDNDGNGVVDDWNGPTYDAHMRPDASPMKRPSAELAAQLAFQLALYKGSADLNLGFDTAEARLFAQRGREAPVADQESDDLLWNEIGGRSHGTAVASEIADGAPFVRLYSVSPQPWGNDPREVVVDEALNDRWIAAVDRLAPRFHNAKVRVVNMSWGYTADEISDKLIRYGGVTDQAQATARAKAMWRKADVAMRRLLAACPDILFVNAAGNSNQTEDILASTPQTIGAPNLLVVGATGTSGLPTSFTTYGKGVKVYAWGEAVPLRLPGGTIAHLSGTSMAAPLVARAAAQMLAVNPALGPQRLIEGVTATSTPGPGGFALLNARAAVDWANAQPRPR